MKPLLSLTLAAFSAVCAISLPLAPAPAAAAETTLTQPERADLLSRLDALHSKHPALQAAFTEERASHLLKKPVSSTGTISFQIPNKFRREVVGSNPSLTVSNGHELWIYYPNFKEAELYTLGQRAMFDDAMAALTAGLNFGHVEAFYSLDAAHEDGKDGGGYRITLTPKKSNLKRIVQKLTVFLDGDLNVHRTDLILAKGEHILTNYTNPRRAPLPASTFEFTPAAEVHVSRPLGK